MKLKNVFVFCLLVAVAFACTNLDEIKSDISDLQERMTTLESEVKELKASFQSNLEKITEIQSKQGEQEQSYLALKSSFDDLENSYNAIQEKINLLEDEINGLEEEQVTEITKLQDQINELKSITCATNFIFFPGDNCESISTSNATTIIGSVYVENEEDLAHLTDIEYITGTLEFNAHFQGHVNLPNLKAIEDLRMSNYSWDSEIKSVIAPNLEHVANEKYFFENTGMEYTKEIDLRNLTSIRSEHLNLGALEKINLSSLRNFRQLTILGDENTVVKLPNYFKRNNTVDLVNLDLANVFQTSVDISNLRIRNCVCTSNINILNVLDIQINNNLNLANLSIDSEKCRIMVDRYDYSEFKLGTVSIDTLNFHYSNNIIDKEPGRTTNLDLSCFNKTKHLERLLLSSRQENIIGLNQTITCEPRIYIYHDKGSLDILNDVIEIKKLKEDDHEFYLNLRDGTYNVFNNLRKNDCPINLYAGTHISLCCLKPYFDLPDDIAPIVFENASESDLTDQCDN